MEFNARKELISVCDIQTQSTAEHSLDISINLPEYLPDIVRILRCTASPSVTSHQVTGDRIITECEATVRVLYICEKGKLNSFEQNVNFSKQLELKNAEYSNDVLVGVKTDYVNYRVSGQRKLEIHGAVTVFSKAICKSSSEIITSAEGDGITARTEKRECCDLVSVTQKSFSISETCETGAIGNKICGVIDCTATPIIDEVKVISNKLFLKADLIVNTAFLCEESGEVHTFETQVGVNQIIEAPDVSDTCDIDASLTLVGLSVNSRFDSAGNKNLIDISATLSLTSCGYSSRAVTVVKDAYSTKYETETKKSTVYLPTLLEKIDDTFLCRSNMDLGVTGIGKILSFACGDATAMFSVNEGGILVYGQVPVRIFFQDTDGEILFVNREIPYEYKRPFNVLDDTILCKPQCCVTASSFVLGEGSTVDARVELSVHGFVFSEKEAVVTTEIALDKSKIKTLKTATLTVYFAECGEELWSIAEQYNTTVDAIVRENKIPDCPLDKKCKLLIPKV